MALKIIRRGAKFAVADGATLLSEHDTFQAANQALSALGCGAVEALFANHDSRPILPTFDDCRLGSQARAQARAGRRCPDWAASEALWARSVAAANAVAAGDEMYPTAVACYRLAGGTFANAEEEGGHWVTMRGSPVFIKDGQNPMDALEQKLAKKSTARGPDYGVKVTANKPVSIRGKTLGSKDVESVGKFLASNGHKTPQDRDDEIAAAHPHLSKVQLAQAYVHHGEHEAMKDTASVKASAHLANEGVVATGGGAGNGTSQFVAAHYLTPVGTGLGLLTRKRWLKKPNPVKDGEAKANAEDGGRWVTMNGAHVFIKGDEKEPDYEALKKDAAHKEKAAKEATKTALTSEQHETAAKLHDEASRAHERAMLKVKDDYRKMKASGDISKHDEMAKLYKAHWHKAHNHDATSSEHWATSIAHSGGKSSVPDHTIQMAKTERGEG